MKITVIGGGTGTTTVLNALKGFSEIDLSVIVTMTDDGGSNAIVRDEFGLLPLSDLRKSILALSSKNKDEILRQLFMYRFDKGGGLDGHTLGNLIMVALSNIAGSEKEAVKICSDIFSVDGKIIPVTFDHTRLIAHYDNNERVVGEHKIEELMINSRLNRLEFTNEANANPEAIDALLKSDFIIIGPGDLFTSIIPNLLVSGIKNAIKKSKAKVIYIANLMTKIGETRGLKQSDIVGEIADYSGRVPDVVLLNNGKMSKQALKAYEEDGESILENDVETIQTNFPKTKVITCDLVSNNVLKKQSGDSLKRSFIRHDIEKLRKELYALVHTDAFAAITRLIQQGIN